jgi:hypothetical protein
VVNIYSTPGSTDYSIGYGTTPFFLYNNGNEMGSTTAEASCRAGTVWDEDELQCLIPPSTINVVVCTIPEGGSSCVTSQDVTWHVENDQGKDFTFYYPENKTDIGGTEGNVGPVTINYGENVFAIKDGEEIIVENRVVGTCTENTNWENGICVLSSPEVKSFKAEPNVIFDGGTSTLSWNFDEELIDSCDISFQLNIDDTVSYLMSTSESTGETDVSPTGTTIYYLDCYRQEGED